MEDVAEKLGVSKGTLYLYVESKEALFDLAVRFADNPEEFPDTEVLPIPTPPPGAVLEFVGARMATDESFAEFASLLSAPPGDDPEAELAAAVRAYYQLLYRNRYALKLVDTCALDHPELSSSWFESGRGVVMGGLVPFIESRIQSGAFVPVPDVGVAARFILETVMVWAVHLHWDPHPESLNHDRIEDTVVHFIVRGLVTPR